MEYANLSPVPFHKVHLKSDFWSPRLASIQKETVRYCIKRCEETGRIANFRRAGGMEEGGFQGIYFNDSDVYKVLEGAAYILHSEADTELEAMVDEIIEAICAAQQEDGYLFTYYILTDLSLRWSDMGYHEAYCLGHMLEGAIAYFQATGKRKWLDVALRALSQMMSIIGPGKKNWVVGHQELELALMRLYRLTAESDYLEYAQWLVSQRGHGHLKAPSFEQQQLYEDYCQDDIPAEELNRVTGHAVRAMYYFSGITDIVAMTGNQALGTALDRLWNNVIPANYYVTGGIGQDASNEGFTKDWHLPNLTAYCETCAAIGMALWNQRMNLLHGDAKYADIVETELYNGVLAGISLDGLRFFYDNPLSSAGTYRRSKWFGCSCCPTNLVRFIPSIGGYVYAVDHEQIFINQYLSSDVELELNKRKVRIEVSTDYPWNGIIKIHVTGEGDLVPVNLRIPEWCERFTLELDGKTFQTTNEKGYIKVLVPIDSNLEINLEIPPRRIYADKRVNENLGRVAFALGPLIYCVEEIDQKTSIPTEYFHSDFSVSKDTDIETKFSPDKLGGIVEMSSDDASLIPYYAWANRNKCAMAVWIKEADKLNKEWPYWK